MRASCLWDLPIRFYFECQWFSFFTVSFITSINKSFTVIPLRTDTILNCLYNSSGILRTLNSLLYLLFVIFVICLIYHSSVIYAVNTTLTPFYQKARFIFIKSISCSIFEPAYSKWYMYLFLLLLLVYLIDLYQASEIQIHFLSEVRRRLLSRIHHC